MLLRKSIHRRTFSLIEVMVAMGLLLLITTAGLFYARPARLESLRFRGTAEGIGSLVTLAQQLSLNYEANTQLVFEKKGQHVRCIFLCDRQLPEFVENFIKKDTQKMRFDKVLFNGRSLERILFDGSLSGAGPIGQLTVHMGKRSFDLELKGFPSTIYKRHP